MNRKKFLTRLLDGKYRRGVLTSMPDAKRQELGIPEYAKYVVEKALLSRNAACEKNKEMLYGFQPLEVFAYVSRGGSLVTRLFEMKSVNHFLAAGDAGSAVEVAQAMVVDWAKSLDDLRGVDVKAIDEGLKKMESEYLMPYKVSNSGNA